MCLTWLKEKILPVLKKENNESVVASFRQSMLYEVIENSNHAVMLVVERDEYLLKPGQISWEETGMKMAFKHNCMLNRVQGAASNISSSDVNVPVENGL